MLLASALFIRPKSTHTKRKRSNIYSKENRGELLFFCLRFLFLSSCKNRTHLSHSAFLSPKLMFDTSMYTRVVLICLSALARALAWNHGKVLSTINLSYLFEFTTFSFFSESCIQPSFLKLLLSLSLIFSLWFLSLGCRGALWSLDEFWFVWCFTVFFLLLYTRSSSSLRAP